MKKRLFGFAFCFLLSNAIFAKNYVTGVLAHDEVTIVFKAKGTSLDVYQVPNLSAKKTQINVKPKQVLKYNQTRVVITPTSASTRKAIELYCDQDLHGKVVPPKKIKVSQGQQIEYLQPTIPDGALVSYQNQICSLNDVAEISPIKEPKAEKWIRLVDGKQKFLGWLFLNADGLRNLKNPQLTHDVVTYDGVVNP